MTNTANTHPICVDNDARSKRRIELALYTSGILIFLISRVMVSILETANFLTYADIASAILMVFGFAFWLLPWAFRRARAEYTPLLWIMIHGTTILYGTLLARSIVAEALGLPPMDFAFTTTVLLVVLYIPALISISACLLALATAIHFVYALFHDLLHKNLYVIRFHLGIFWPKFSPSSQTKELLGIKYLLRLAGAIIMAIFLFGAATTLTPSTQVMSSITRWTAFFADYFPLSNYPGIPANARVNLHENGRVSIAEIAGEDIKITVYELDKLPRMGH